MSHDQKPTRVRVVGSSTANAPTNAAGKLQTGATANAADGAAQAEQTASRGGRIGLILLFVIAAALGGVLQAWFLR
ncbi:hypothetical protein [Stakelama pacifica]|uniref:Uncharacterized protein n=1 Tax=Stakelama pacifica TaxID=517720 RepID=A0A4R6FI99_9SPHN|nr:hypothetical protein [Stakelama pacifica]TDN81161.1 hypothetical protein EV664_108103 [Stakelama pacifica]GGO96933.1 hypothetical protein GCM10011329_24600 [Stakelama pacifica]